MAADETLPRLSEGQEAWLRLLDGPPSAFCRSEKHWDRGGIRAYTAGTRIVNALERKGLVEFSGPGLHATVALTELGRSRLRELTCGDCEGLGWECGDAACDDEAAHESGRACKHARPCGSCDGRGV